METAGQTWVSSRGAAMDAFLANRLAENPTCSPMLLRDSVPGSRDGAD